MPILTKRPPKLRRHARGQAIVVHGGKTIYFGPWGSREARVRYRAFCADWRPAELTPPPAAPLGHASVKELAALWVVDAETRYTKRGKQTSTIGTYKTVLRELVGGFGHLKVREFGPLRLEALRARFVALGLARVMCNRYARQTISIFRWGVSKELVPVDVPTALAMLPALRPGQTKAPEVRPVRPVSADVVDRTLPFLPPIVAAIVRLQQATGMRPNEVLSIRPCDIDRTSDTWVYKPIGHKLEHKGIERVVFIGPRGQDVLRPYLLRGETEYCFDPRKEGPRKRGGTARYTTCAYCRAIARGCELAFGMPADIRPTSKRMTKAERAERCRKASEWRRANTWHPNQLRHSFATEARKLLGIEAARAALGHTELATTEIYAERDADLAAAVVRRIG